MNDTQSKLVNIAQIAKMGNRHLATAYRWALRDDFPALHSKPTYLTKALYNRAEAEQWLKDNLSLTGKSVRRQGVKS